MGENQTIGQYIRLSREHIGITLIEFAMRLNLSKSYVSDVERDNRTVTAKRLAHMAYVIADDPYYGRTDTQERWLCIYHIMLERANLMSPSLKALKQIEGCSQSEWNKPNNRIF